MREQYGDWVIHYDPPPIPIRSCDWHFYHKDYDGAPDGCDNRCGHGPTLEDCKAQINDIEADQAQEVTRGETLPHEPGSYRRVFPGGPAFVSRTDNTYNWGNDGWLYLAEDFAPQDVASIHFTLNGQTIISKAQGQEVGRGPAAIAKAEAPQIKGDRRG